jgi:hypothetical protein
MLWKQRETVYEICLQVDELWKVHRFKALS